MKALFSLLVIGSVGYLAMMLAVYFLQGRMVFLADLPGRALTASPRHIGLAFESVRIATEDGEQIHGWYVPHAPAGESRGVLLFFHGNAGNISHRLDSLRIFNALGLDVLMVDYRGYGESTGTPSEAGIYTDGEAAWNYLVNERAIEPSRIVVFGRSLGAVVAARVASQATPGALIIESGFTSGVEMAKRIYWFLPARLITRLEFPLVDFARGVDCPVLVIHSRDDEIIPFELGEAIFEAIPGEDKSFLEIWGGHNTGFYLSEEKYIPALENFLAGRLPKTPSDPN
ncbi:MAG: alpha/beta hydrolase [Xanthomonadales bacterium]|nr:alpha/beta hydrolase [Xanthomonadales bacterium]